VRGVREERETERGRELASRPLIAYYNLNGIVSFENIGRFGGDKI